MTETNKQTKTKSNNDLLLSMEWGYKAHEKGFNLDMAIIEFKKLLGLDKTQVKQLRKILG